MLKQLLLITALTATPLAASAQATPELVPLSAMPAGAYVLDLSHASLTFKVTHMGLSNYTARFSKLDAKINLDPKDITKSTLVATVDPTSVKTDYPNPEKEDFDAKIGKDKDWLNGTQFPEIKFESTKIEKTGEKTGKIYGNLTFLGVTKPLVLDTTFIGAYVKKPMMGTPGMGFSATTTLKRSDWGFKTYVPMIGDDVKLTIETEFNKAQ